MGFGRMLGTVLAGSALLLTAAGPGAAGAAAASPGRSAAAPSPTAADGDEAAGRALRRQLQQAGLAPAPASPRGRDRTDAVTIRVGPQGVRALAVREQASPAPVLRSDAVGPDQLLVVALDAAGRGLATAVVQDPRVLRAELPADDGQLSGQTVRREQADVVAPLPALQQTTGVGVYAVDDDGSRLTLLGTSDLPPPEPEPESLAEPAAAPVTTIFGDGAADNRVDIAVLGDGYTSAQQPDFARDAQALVSSILQEQPLSAYRSYFSVRRLDVVSAESGADHPDRSPPVHVDTALGAYYDCGGYQRLICVDEDAVRATLDASLPAAQQDLVLLVVNDPEYGGSGGTYAVASMSPTAPEQMLHEIGHVFGLLADEYGGSSDPSCSADEPKQVNATRDVERSRLKWRAWVEADTPLPTTDTGTDTGTGAVGAYEGAEYCDTGFYRPTASSKMRELGRPFEQVNSEQLVRRTYAFVRPVESRSPAETAVAPRRGQSQTFSVRTLRPATHALSVTWQVDGRPVSTGPTYTLAFDDLGPGEHVVEAVVQDRTAFVRSDPEQLLEQRTSWQVAAADTEPPVAPGPPTDVTASAGRGSATVGFSPPASDGGSPVTGYEVTSAPDGRTCSTSGSTTCSVTGLTDGTSYTFTVTATSRAGTSRPSAPSGSVTPQAPAQEPGPSTGPAPSPAAGGGPAARSIDAACPRGRVPGNPFSDVPGGSTHERAISCLVWWQVANGRTATSYAPAAGVTRDAMAAFVARTIQAAAPGALPADPPDAFTDDGGSVHQHAINQLAAAGVVGGTGAGRYSPGAGVTRGQMARFLANAVKHVTGRPLPIERDLFSDDSSSLFQDDVNRVAQAGLTGGRADGTYDPTGPVLRDQMGSFLARTLDLFVAGGARLPQ